MSVHKARSTCFTYNVIQVLAYITFSSFPYIQHKSGVVSVGYEIAVQ